MERDDTRPAADSRRRPQSWRRRSERAGTDADFTLQWLTRTLAVVALSLALFTVLAVVFFRPGPDDAAVIGVARLEWDADRDDALGEGKAASVEIIEDDGRFSAYVFDIEVLRPPASFESLEVWLVDVDAEGGAADRLSVGAFDAIRTRLFALPEGIDPVEYERVEFSLEPDDGDDAFSGRTLVAGDLVWITAPPQ